ncbi:hypothetical protein ATE48_00330 [Candidatus Viadribacter manganicus]|uniref:Recombinase XerD n=2 Tax=Candidatus Viadribacter manganicus TaxID=1759059 RepID=A0A1B1AD39_9PROT|nr:site-specific tyrosine recombinase XerC [Candidatus Viadribacter manganicus]ANP44476.1 hypothetical protein ATE48_00330 [Candidatus Viadribacter manganicus]
MTSLFASTEAVPCSKEPSDVSVDMPTLLTRFSVHLASRNYSPYTIEQRVIVASDFIAWAKSEDIDQAGDVTPDLIEAFRMRLFVHRKTNGQPLAVRTQTVRLVALRAFFRWLARERVIGTDPSASLELPRAERRLPRAILSQHEVEAILALPDIAKPLGLRDRAILETFYVTGMRRLELTRLCLRDVDHARQLILIRKGKGGKDRIVPTGERALAWLLAYRKIARPKLAGALETDRLFLTSRGTSLHPKKLTARVSAYISAAKLGKAGSCHLFRHAAATHMLENGADIRFIQAMLGHESLDTTRIYTHVSIGPLASVHARTHPAARFNEWDSTPPSA